MDSQHGDTSQDASVDRRGFLAAAGVALTSLVALATGIVGAVYALAPALGRRTGAASATEWTKLPDVRPERSEGPRRHSVTVTSDAGWARTHTPFAVFVDATDDGRPVAFSARCPHEGCLVGWEPAEAKYVCPCHASSWTRDGERLGGPTKRGLDPLDLRPDDTGTLEVRYTTFLLDTTDRIEIG